MKDLREKVLEISGKDLGPLEGELKMIDLGNLKNLFSSNINISNNNHADRKDKVEGPGEDLSMVTTETAKGKE